MIEKQWRQEASACLQEIIRLLKLYEDVTFIGQEPYKGAFFKVFAEAHRSGYCTFSYRPDEKKGHFVQCKAQRPLISGDAIWSYAKRQGWVHGETTGDEKRYRDIEMVRIWWDEWVYAWQHPVPRRKYVRRRSEGGA